MDWLAARQERIEHALAARHLTDGGFVLYDLSSSYFEGRHCPLAALGHNRDGKKGKLQVNWGLICSPEGRPVSVQVHPGNTADPKTLPGVLDTVAERFAVKRAIFVGDRAMITQAHAQKLKELGAGFVSALKTVQIRTLISSGDLQLSLFDETNLAEITSEEFPGERLIVCRNPHLAAERARKREDLLVATEAELAKVKRMVDGPRGRLKDADAGKIGERAGPRSATSTRSPSTSSSTSPTAPSPTSARPSRSRRRPRWTASTRCAPPAPKTSCQAKRSSGSTSN